MEDSLDSKVPDSCVQHYIQRSSAESQSQRHTAGKFTVDQARWVDNNLETSVCEAAVYEYLVDYWWGAAVTAGE